MAYIRIAPMEELDASVRKQLEAVRKTMGGVGEIAQVLSLRADIYNMTSGMVRTLLINQTELPYHIKESIAILVSKENSCTMCVGEHERMAKLLGMTEEQINQVLEGIDRMEIPDNERTLLQFCLKSGGKENYKVTQGDVDAVRNAGYTDSQILEAVAIVGYFNYINTISNALGAGK
ncbi:MAG: carboxymuconolactone decarboxylase family protein [Deltaproteobacteria bacterium]|nr:carboxymuconolactone decarboxylase family protein [Deltaproteobacteria bacterium]MBW1923901.1 carboxymuconolactone decarboxylase family protein [Deltaproteobacteria bacterium]MBW1948919.1 carboxymuconolactone decarboxylase family protein [Deltaproteobacteria bacterium]MBW2008211.1 carboxymuconolactone decarboxylase family protein [Deltaproteobacteria bacterium]MBW2347670.1 carboxymuconolactone decarboxylase family protein [Deltaproteobacteria bacterium]